MIKGDATLFCRPVLTEEKGCVPFFAFCALTEEKGCVPFCAFCGAFARSMAEVPHPGEHHGDVALVGCRDHFGIAL
jgi:hypothetical protein